MGWLDRFDVRRFAEMAHESWGDDFLVVHGVSMGAATTMMLSGDELPEYFRAFARAIVTDAKRAGFNGTWSPVVDVVGSGTNNVSRRISDDPLLVAKGAAEISHVYANNHFLSCGKHYPGGTHGGTDQSC